jgi:hypothetical protein
MVLCDNALCTEEIADCGHVVMAGRKFCCLACADGWRRQNDALIEAGAPFHLPVRENNHTGPGAELLYGRRRK